MDFNHRNWGKKHYFNGGGSPGQWIGHWRVPSSFCGVCFFFSCFFGLGPLGTEEKEQHTKQIENDLLEEVLFLKTWKDSAMILFEAF